MLLVMLAAGSGSRLMPLTRNTLKMLLDLRDGTTLPERQIDAAIQSARIDDVVIVSGHLLDQIESKVQCFDDCPPTNWHNLTRWQHSGVPHHIGSDRKAS